MLIDRTRSERRTGFCARPIYVAEHFHNDLDFTELDQWEVLFYAKDRLHDLVRRRKVEPEIRLFSIVSADLDNGQEFSTQTGFELPFAINEAEEEAIYQHALAAANAWERRQNS